MSTDAGSLPDDGAVLGLSFDYHDAAAALLVGGDIVAAATEERFTRVKHDPALPNHALRWVLDEAGVGDADLAAVVFYDKPITTYERILVTHARVGPAGIRELAHAVSRWSTSKLWTAYRIERAIRATGRRMPRLYFAEHHRSHAASAFHPSPFERAAILTFDGVGEWTTTSIAHGVDNRVEMLRELSFPDSLGLFYSTITAHCGFPVNDGEFKLMGLAPYGEPRFAETMRNELIHVSDDGSIRLNGRYFDFQTGRRMGSSRLDSILDGPPRTRSSDLTQREADLARSAQVVLEDAVLSIARHAYELTAESDVCLAGGVALNCVANRRLLEDGPFDRIWVQPAAGDDGAAIGAATWVWHEVAAKPRPPRSADGMHGCRLGPGFHDREIVDWLNDESIEFQHVPDRKDLNRLIARRLDDGATVGWFQGRMEFGPRALGARSILADPRDSSMVRHINSTVKRREGFRPFAPAVLEEEAERWFEITGSLPYMTITAPVAAERLCDLSPPRPDIGFAELLGRRRSAIPACTHLDGSARVQTVSSKTAPELHGLLRAFRDRTGCPVLLNTSFNGRDEPIVHTPADALRCFRATGLDVLVMEHCVIDASTAR